MGMFRGERLIQCGSDCRALTSGKFGNGCFAAETVGGGKLVRAKTIGLVSGTLTIYASCGIISLLQAGCLDPPALHPLLKKTATLYQPPLEL